MRKPNDSQSIQVIDNARPDSLPDPASFEGKALAFMANIAEAILSGRQLGILKTRATAGGPLAGAEVYVLVARAAGSKANVLAILPQLYEGVNGITDVLVEPDPGQKFEVSLGEPDTEELVDTVRMLSAQRKATEEGDMGAFLAQMEAVLGKAVKKTTGHGGGRGGPAGKN